MPGLRIEGFVIVSADGRLANGHNVMPDDLKIEGDKRFFTAALDRVDLVVHGRNSGEEQPNSPKRRRLILTHKVQATAQDPSNPKALLWNPAGCSFEAACRAAGVTSGLAAIIGGPGVFGMFMDRYDTFWLSVAPHVHIPDGEPCFPGVPARSPQQVLAAHGLHAGEPQLIDAEHDVSVTPWRRVA
ncbi:dihydrofolate reductase [Bradyrhizobium sp. ISRA443]|uniref:dihydrofolate reductase n=1 Tax=unclassified Bradyrhizobium TaxID=2631580 RepID=UPI0024783FFB|nr:MULTISPECIES: dihydrofolate reductase [unclassified Bradyrhizobium]WGR92368.1 dihydrofolate reductase [Bradyrhizobium sp. ISRA435]WGR96713.1 dihydrofolate reductase [Bradyrhizobium sp. ISRA436]WGS03600.1 dihydrofolate reductase [Bradyrhizobium sp. ISRA437]WGS10484.1 dihydrofolate reductase [Bradyrhizobium sp. ISRA443]